MKLVITKKGPKGTKRINEKNKKVKARWDKIGTAALLEITIFLPKGRRLFQA